MADICCPMIAQEMIELGGRPNVELDFYSANSKTFSLAPHFSCVPQNGYATANLAVLSWQHDLKNAFSARHRHTNQ
jgi:hypothetical protein